MGHNNIISFRPHPGVVLGEMLKERGILQKELATKIGIRPSHLNELIKGKKSFTVPFAMALEEALGFPYSYWMHLQFKYEHDCIVRAQREAERQRNMPPTPKMTDVV